MGSTTLHTRVLETTKTKRVLVTISELMHQIFGDTFPVTIFFFNRQNRGQNIHVSLADEWITVYGVAN